MYFLLFLYFIIGIMSVLITSIDDKWRCDNGEGCYLKKIDGEYYAKIKSIRIPRGMFLTIMFFVGPFIALLALILCVFLPFIAAYESIKKFMKLNRMEIED